MSPGNSISRADQYYGGERFYGDITAERGRYGNRADQSPHAPVRAEECERA